MTAKQAMPKKARATCYDCEGRGIAKEDIGKELGFTYSSAHLVCAPCDGKGFHVVDKGSE